MPRASASSDSWLTTLPWPTMPSVPPRISWLPFADLSQTPACSARSRSFSRRRARAAWVGPGTTPPATICSGARAPFTAMSCSARSARRDIPEETYAELATEARRRWPTPWQDAIADSIARRAVTASPISEYLPDRLVAGRLVLVGDAAHVPTPMTGRGFAASLADGQALAGAVAQARADHVPDDLLAYQRQR